MSTVRAKPLTTNITGTDPVSRLLSALQGYVNTQRPAAIPTAAVGASDVPASVDTAGATADAVAEAAAATDALATDANTAADATAASNIPNISVYSEALSGYPVFNLTVPDISYTPPTMEELLLEAQQLYSGGYNRQTQAAQKAYADALADLQRTYAQNRENVQNAATARGFGRSNYVTDALAQLGDREALAQQRNAEQLLQQLSNLGMDYENQMSAYASQQYRAGQQQAYENELLKAQLQMELDKLGYQSAVSRFLYEQEHPNLYADPNATAASSGGGVSGVVAYNPYWESVDTSMYNGGSSSSSSRKSSGGSSGSGGSGGSSPTTYGTTVDNYLSGLDTKNSHADSNHFVPTQPINPAVYGGSYPSKASASAVNPASSSSKTVQTAAQKAAQAIKDAVANKK